MSLFDIRLEIYNHWNRKTFFEKLNSWFALIPALAILIDSTVDAMSNCFRQVLWGKYSYNKCLEIIFKKRLRRHDNRRVGSARHVHSARPRARCGGLRGSKRKELHWRHRRPGGYLHFRHPQPRARTLQRRLYADARAILTRFFQTISSRHSLASSGRISRTELGISYTASQPIHTSQVKEVQRNRRQHVLYSM